MKFIKWTLLGILALGLIIVSLANRTSVELNLLPQDLANLVGVSASISLPLYLVLFGGVIIGVMLGYLGEWLREHHHRAARSRAEKEADVLKREMRKLKRKAPAEDDVLALLETEAR